MEASRRNDKLVDIPVLLHARNLTEFSLSPYHLTNVRGLPAVIRGVRKHPSLTRRLWVAEWTDERWLDLRVKAEALQLSAPHAVLTHCSAAELHGWPLPSRLTSTSAVHVTSPTSLIRRRGFRGHGPAQVLSVTAHRVTVARHDETLRQISGLLTEDELLATVEAICGSWHGPRLSTVSALALLVRDGSEWQGFLGRPRLLTVLRRARDGVGSPQETRLRIQLQAAGFPEPEVAAEVVVNGRTYHPDLSYREHRIALEYEGDQHRVDSRQWEHDIRREADFRAAGWEYIRVTRHTPLEQVSSLLDAAFGTSRRQFLPRRQSA